MMKLISGDNNQDCMGAAFAMATSTSLEEVQGFCGHDGSQGYTAQEMTDYALSKRYATITHFGKECYTNDAPEIDFEKYIPGNVGVVGFQRKDGKTHAAATDGTTVYDPKGMTYPLEYLLENTKILIFWQIERLCACNSR